jgi:hypothetical protein
MFRESDFLVTMSHTPLCNFLSYEHVTTILLGMCFVNIYAVTCHIDGKYCIYDESVDSVLLISKREKHITVHASYLESCFPRCHLACPDTWTGILLTVKKTSVECTVIINDLPLLTVNLFVKSAFADVSCCWCVSLSAVLWASSQLIRAEKIFPTRLVRKPHSGLTLRPACPLFVCQDNWRQ